MKYILEHTCLQLCWTDLIFLAILAAAIVIIYKKLNKLKEQQAELEKQLSAVDGANTSWPEAEEAAQPKEDSSGTKKEMLFDD